MSLSDRLKKNSTIKDTALIMDSKVFGKKDLTPTKIPILNVALSGSIDGGFGAGSTVFAGPSKHFKTLFVLVCAKAFQDKNPDGVILWYDSEFGSPPDYFSSMGIDLNRVVYTPITNIEQLKFDIAKQLDGINRGDKVFIAIDSLGNLASKKEIEDALNENSAADMTRAKQMKSFFRIVTPQLTLKDIPMFSINHTYKTMEMYAKDIVSGGTGITYSSDNVYIIGRRQSKEGKELVGNEFVIRVEKSRFVREKSEFPVMVKFKGGIEQFSGLLEIALEGGYVVKPNNGWYQRANPKTGETLEEGKHREKDTVVKEFWQLVFEKTDFAQFITDRYKIGTLDMLKDQELNLDAMGSEEEMGDD